MGVSVWRCRCGQVLGVRTDAGLDLSMTNVQHTRLVVRREGAWVVVRCGSCGRRGLRAIGATKDGHT